MRLAFLRLQAAGAAAFAACSIFGTAVHAQTQSGQWPTRPITWVIPFTPGGITDSTSRLVGRKISEELGQPVLIENRGGAGGMLGTEIVAKAPPDGYTMIYGTQGTLAANLALYKNVRYEPLRDFVPVHALMETANVVVVNANRPYKTLEELVEFARKNPGKVNVASAGTGTGSHLAGELFASVAGIKMTHVPYKGSAPALTDLAAGSVDAMFDYPVSSMALIRSGKLRALAVTGKKRVAQFPDVPTVVEAGYPQALSSSWSGILVPARTPPEVVVRLNRAIAAALESPEVVKYTEDNGSTILHGVSGPAFTTFIAAEGKRWGEVVRKSGASVD